MMTRKHEFDDKTLAYFEMGEGPAVVIIHGVGGHKEDWREVATHLSVSRRVFAVDMLGFGKSSKDHDDLSIPVQAAAIKSLLEAHKIEAADLIGNSVGGWVAATFAAEYPDKVNGLILLDVAGFKAMFEGEPPVNFDPSTVEEMQALLAITTNSDLAQTHDIAEQAFEAYIASGEKAVSAIWAKSIFISPRLEDILPKIAAPTLVLWGEDDKLFPSTLCAVFAEQIDEAAHELIPNAGHFPHLDNPTDTIAAIENFLVMDDEMDEEMDDAASDPTDAAE